MLITVSNWKLFNFRERVIEYRLGSGQGRLASLSSAELVKTVAARSPAPGGGSVVALVGALVSLRSKTIL